MNEQENIPHLPDVGAGIPDWLPCLAAHSWQIFVQGPGVIEGQSWQFYLPGAPS